MRPIVFHGLIEHENVYANLNEKSLSFLMFPHGIASKTIIAKNALKLAPLAPLSNIFGDQKHAPVAITVEGTKVYVTSTGKPSKTDPNELPRHLYTPLWWVEGTPDESLVNMKLVSIKFQGLTIPVLQNTRGIKINERLYAPKPKDAKVVLKDAEVIAAKRARNKSRDAD